MKSVLRENSPRTFRGGDTLTKEVCTRQQKRQKVWPELENARRWCYWTRKSCSFLGHIAYTEERRMVCLCARPSLIFIYLMHAHATSSPKPVGFALAWPQRRTFSDNFYIILDGGRAHTRIPLLPKYHRDRGINYMVAWGHYFVAKKLFFWPSGKFNGCSGNLALTLVYDDVVWYSRILFSDCPSVNTHKKNTKGFEYFQRRSKKVRWNSLIINQWDSFFLHKHEEGWRQDGENFAFS